jgi:hypothetical protein
MEETHFPTTVPPSSHNSPPSAYEDGLEVYQFDGLETHYQDGLERVDHDDKQAYNHNDKQVCAENEKEAVNHPTPLAANGKSIFGLRIRYVIIGTLLLVVIGLASGLGAGFGRKSSKSVIVLSLQFLNLTRTFEGHPPR